MITELRKSGLFGSEVHDMLTKLITGQTVKETPSTKAMISGYQLWKKQHSIDIYFTDVFVQHPKYEWERWLTNRYQYSGFVDAIGMNHEGDLIVIDFKSGKSVYKYYALQLAAYCKAVEVTCDCKESIRHAYVLRFNRDNANFDFLRVIDIDKCFAYFLNCIELTKMRKEKSGLFEEILLSVC